jgi:hypothetical protein
MLFSCYSRIIVSGYLSDNGSPYGFQFTLDSSTQMKDQHGRLWAPETPIMAIAQRSQVSLHIGLTKSSQFLYNAYIDKQTISNYAKCPSDRKCCGKATVSTINQDSYGLANNKTVFVKYNMDVNTAQTEYSISISLKQGSTTRVLTMNQDITSAATDSVKASIQGNLMTSNTVLNALATNAWTIIHESVTLNPQLINFTPEPFIITSPYYFGSSKLHSIGMTSNDFMNLASCVGIEDVTTVNDGPRWDQFATFRSNTLTKMIGGSCQLQSHPVYVGIVCE